MLDLSVKEISHDHNTSCHECFCALAKNDPQDHFCLRRALAALLVSGLYLLFA